MEAAETSSKQFRSNASRLFIRNCGLGHRMHVIKKQMQAVRVNVKLRAVKKQQQSAERC